MLITSTKTRNAFDAPVRIPWTRRARPVGLPQYRPLPVATPWRPESDLSGAELAGFFKKIKKGLKKLHKATVKLHTPGLKLFKGSPRRPTPRPLTPRPLITRPELRPFDPRLLPQRATPRPLTPSPSPRAFDPREALNPTPWRPAWAQQRAELGELGGFFKKIGKSIKKVTKKVGAAVKKVAKKVGKFIKKNAKWIVVAAAIAVTIYTMGGAAGIAAKLAAAGAKIKGAAITAGKWIAAKGSALKAGISKLLSGKKMGELNPQEAEALATANAETGEQIVPTEITSLLAQKAVDVGTGILTKKAMTLADGAVMGDQSAMEADGGQELSPDESAQAFERAAQGPQGPGFMAGMPSWVLPAAIGGGALVLLLILKK